MRFAQAGGLSVADEDATEALASPATGADAPVAIPVAAWLPPW